MRRKQKGPVLASARVHATGSLGEVGFNGREVLVSSTGQRGLAFGRGSAHVCASASQGVAMARRPFSSGPARWCVRLCMSKGSTFGLWEDGAHARAHGKAVAATWPRRSRNAGKAGPRRCLAATRNEGDGGVPAQKR